jgi:hypothetical protein
VREIADSAPGGNQPTRKLKAAQIAQFSTVLDDLACRESCCRHLELDYHPAALTPLGVHLIVNDGSCIASVKVNVTTPAQHIANLPPREANACALDVPVDLPADGGDGAAIRVRNDAAELGTFPSQNTQLYREPAIVCSTP